MATASDQLRWALQALAAPAEQQLQLFPSFVCVPDELALEFDQWLRAVAAEATFTAEQQVVLARLDERISAWSGPAHPEVWTTTALATHPVWSDFRALACEALAAFGWPADLPPSNRAGVYVHG